MNIVLMGYRGCGKTTIGKMLAQELWKKFVDVDVEASKRLGNLTVAQVWEKFGEAKWREAEIAVTKELMARKDHVIGLGGGTLMQPAAREAVEQAPDTVRIYLSCAPEELFKRISADKQSAATRPNLTNLGGGIEEIKAVLAQRDPVYRAVANKVFDVTHTNPKDAVRFVIAKCL